MNNYKNQSSNTHPMHHAMRKFITGFAMIGLVVISYFAYTNPNLFQGCITCDPNSTTDSSSGAGGGSKVPVNNNSTASHDFYLVNTEAKSGSSVLVDVKTNKDLSNISSLSFSLNKNTNQFSISGIPTNELLPHIRLYQTATYDSNNVSYYSVSAYIDTSKKSSFKKGETVFKLKVDVKSGLSDGTAVNLLVRPNDSSHSSNYVIGSSNSTVTQVSDGRVTINSKLSSTEPPTSNSSSSLSGGNGADTFAGSNNPPSSNKDSDADGLADPNSGAIASAPGASSTTAALTGGGTQPSTKDFYIPDNYKAGAGETGYFEVRAGQEIVQLLNTSIRFKADDASKIRWTGVESPLNVPAGSLTYSNVAPGETVVTFVPANVIASIAKDTVVFKLKFEIDSSVKVGDVINITAYEGDVSKSYIVQQLGQQGTQRKITFGNGKLEIIQGSPTQTVFTPFQGGANLNSEVNLYIPNDYIAVKGQKDQIEVRVGQEFQSKDLEGLKLILEAPKTKLTFLGIDQKGGKLESETPQLSIDSSNGRVQIDFGQFKQGYKLFDNDLLFKLNVELNSNLVTSDTIDIKMNTASQLVVAGNPPVVPTFSDGLITIQNSVTPPASAGSDLAGIVLTLAKSTIDQLSTAERAAAYKTAYVIINAPDAEGKTITVEGLSVVLTKSTAITNCNVSKLVCIQSMVDELKKSLAIPNVNVSDTGIPGVIKLEATGFNVSLNDATDQLGSTSGEVIIVPGMNNTLDLPQNKTYQLRLIGKKSDGSLLPLTFNDVKWQPQPVNQVDKTSLDAGLLKRGDSSGVSSIFVETQSTTKQLVKSNQLTVNVASEALIEYVRRIGTGALARGSQLDLEFKITDADQIADIKDIRMSIVRTNAGRYVDVLSDSSAVRFLAKIIGQTTTKEVGTQNQTGTTTLKENFRIYNVSLEIPQQTDLFDGNYQLVLEVTDVNGRTVGEVLPIKIGVIAGGDVNGDGKLTMLDVILAFQIVSGNAGNTSADQLKNADINGDGKVTMIDVINLFNQINK